MKIITRSVILFCLLNITCVPIWRWALSPATVSLSTVAGFIAATAAPLGILIAAIASKNFAPAGGSQNPS